MHEIQTQISTLRVMATTTPAWTESVDDVEPTSAAAATVAPPFTLAALVYNATAMEGDEVGVTDGVFVADFGRVPDRDADRVSVGDRVADAPGVWDRVNDLDRDALPLDGVTAWRRRWPRGLRTDNDDGIEASNTITVSPAGTRESADASTTHFERKTAGDGHWRWRLGSPNGRLGLDGSQTCDRTHTSGLRDLGWVFLTKITYLYVIIDKRANRISNVLTRTKPHLRDALFGFALGSQTALSSHAPEDGLTLRQTPKVIQLWGERRRARTGSGCAESVNGACASTRKRHCNSVSAPTIDSSVNLIHTLREAEARGLAWRPMSQTKHKTVSSV